MSFTGLGLLLALAGFGLAIDAGMFQTLAAAIMVLLGAVLLIAPLQARLGLGGSKLWESRIVAGQFAMVLCSARRGHLASVQHSGLRRFWRRRAAICRRSR